MNIPEWRRNYDLWLEFFKMAYEKKGDSPEAVDDAYDMMKASFAAKKHFIRVENATTKETK